jgi:RNA polymerase sigma-70 factor (ECF subfamily)
LGAFSIAAGNDSNRLRVAYTLLMEPSDKDIVQQTLSDRHTFRILVERYQDALLRYIRRLGCKDIEMAKDVLQESFIKAYLNLNDYDSAYSFSTWIYRITHNETMSYFRKQKNRPQAVVEESALYMFDTLPDGFNMVEEMDNQLRSRAIATALGKLQPQYRDVLVLRFFEEKSYDEIADILRIPNGTVATYLARGKADLGSLLTEYKEHEI